MSFPQIGPRLTNFLSQLANGLSNANKFTSSGNITFRVRQVEETASQIVVEFIIADSGIGISKTVLPTLFTPFQSVFSFSACSCPQY